MKSGGEHRPDLPDGCREEVQLSFLRWMWGYPKRVRPRVLAILAALGPEVAVHHLRSDDDVRRFLESV